MPDPATTALDRFEQLLRAGGAVAVAPDGDAALGQIVEAARELTGAGFAVLSVEDPGQPARVLTAGPDAAERSASAGLVCPDPASDVVCSSIVIGQERCGALWAGEKDPPGAFGDDDAGTIELLARWAAAAIEQERLRRALTASREELGRARTTMRSAMEIAAAVGGDTDLTRTLELIATRARSLVRASALLIWLRHGDELRIAAVSGDATVPADATMPIDESTAGDAIRGRSSSRSEDAQGMRVSPARFGMPDASSSLVVPLLHHGRGLGVLMAFDHRGALASFDPDDERALEAFAASAATAVATARLVEEQRLHDSMAAAEHERGRWARELHDETLQGLAGLKLILARALRAPDLARHELESAMAQVDADIGALRTIIADLRPAALDELGLEPALRTLVERVGQSAGLETRLSTALGETRLGSHVETVAYRVVQEALTNVVRHAGAVAVAVDVLLDDARLRITISDDGRGISSPRDGGYGIVGMRERAALAGGTVSVAPVAGGGTRVALTLPVS